MEEEFHFTLEDYDPQNEIQPIKEEKKVENPPVVEVKEIKIEENNGKVTVDEIVENDGGQDKQNPENQIKIEENDIKKPKVAIPRKKDNTINNDFQILEDSQITDIVTKLDNTTTSIEDSTFIPRADSAFVAPPNDVAASIPINPLSFENPCLTPKELYRQQLLSKKFEEEKRNLLIESLKKPESQDPIIDDIKIISGIIENEVKPEPPKNNIGKRLIDFIKPKKEPKEPTPPRQILVEIKEEIKHLNILSRSIYTQFVQLEDISPIVISFSQELAEDQIEVRNIEGLSVPFLPTISPKPKIEGEWVIRNHDLMYQNAEYSSSEKYTVKVPSGFNVSGYSLQSDYSFTFETPTIHATALFPQIYHTLSTTFVAAFCLSEPINRVDFLEHLDIRSAGVKYRLSNYDEFMASKQLDSEKILTDYEENNTIFITPVTPIPHNTYVRIALKSGYRSVVGSLKTKEEIVLISATTCKEFEITVTIQNNNLIEFQSNHPYVTLDDAPTQNFIRFTPPIQGEWVITPSYFTFRPTEFPPSVNLRIDISQEITSVYGGVRKEQGTFFFPINLMSITVRNLFTEIHSTIPTNPVYLLLFTQFISPENIIENFTIYKNSSRNKKPYCPPRLVSYEELQNIEEADNYFKQNNVLQQYEGKWVAFTSSIPLEHDTEYVFECLNPLPSEEGSALTSFNFRSKHRTCEPFDVEIPLDGDNGRSDIFLRSTHALDPQKFRINFDPPFEVRMSDGVWQNYKKYKLVYYLFVANRIPKSTLYNITIPTTSLSRMYSALSTDYTVNYQSELNNVTLIRPYNGKKNVSLRPFLEFRLDHEVDLNTLKEYVYCSAKKQTFELEYFTNETITHVPRSKNTNRNLANVFFRPTTNLPPNSKITFGLRGVPSNLGPSVNPEGGSWTFTTDSTLFVKAIEFSLAKLQIEFSQKLSCPNLVVGNGEDITFQDLQTGNWAPRIEPPLPDIPGITWTILNNKLELNAPAGGVLFNFGTDYNITVTPDFTTKYFGKLVTPFQASIKTPLGELSGFYPGDESMISLEPIFLLEFNHPVANIDREKILEALDVKLVIKKKKDQAVRMTYATEEEIRRLKYSDNININNCLGIKPKKKLPMQIQVVVKISPLIKIGSFLKSTYKYSTTSFFTCEFSVDMDKMDIRMSSMHKALAPTPTPIFINFPLNVAFVNDTLDPELTPLIVPETPGNWVFTQRQFTFTPTEYWKKSTIYKVTVHGAIASEFGTTIGKNKVFEFNTSWPVPKVIYPSSSSTLIGPNQVFVLRFDQPIDSESVIKSTSFYTKTGVLSLKKNVIQCVESTEDELEKMHNPPSDEVRMPMMGVEVLIAPKIRLPFSSKVTLVVGAGVLPQDGNVPSNQKHEYTFRCVRPFEIVKEKEISLTRGRVFQILFTNPIAAFSLKEAITVSPPLEGVDYFLKNDKTTLRVQIPVAQENNRDTIYKFTFLENFKDVYGNNLPANRSFLDVKVLPNKFPFSLRAVREGIMACDPLTSNSPFYRVITYNYSEVRVCLYRLNVQKDLRHWNTVRPSSAKFVKYDQDQSDPLNFGKKVFDKVIKIENYEPNQECFLDIDLLPACNASGVGQVGIVVHPTIEAHYPNIAGRPIINSWVQVTNIGIEAIDGGGKMHVWAYDLTNSVGPWKDVSIRMSKLKSKLFSSAIVQRTDENGLTVFENFVPGEQFLLTAQKDDNSDIVFLHPVTVRPYVSDKFQILWHVFTDRGYYRPKETVTIQGYVRSLKLSKESYYEKLSIPTDYNQISYEVYDARKVLILTSIENITVNQSGNFSLEFKLPDTANLGKTKINFSIISTKSSDQKLVHTHEFEIQEFKTPEFKTKVELLDTEVIYYPGSARIKGETNYFSGGSLPFAKVNWNVLSTSSTVNLLPLAKYNFGNHSGLTFASYSKTLKAETNEDGKCHLRISFLGTPTHYIPIRINAAIETISDNNENDTAETSFVIYPAPFVVGLFATGYPHIRSKEKLQNFTVEVVVANDKGNYYSGVSVYVTVVVKLLQSSQITETFEFVSEDKPYSRTFDFSEFAEANSIQVFGEAKLDDYKSASLLFLTVNTNVPPPAVSSNDLALLIEEEKEELKSALLFSTANGGPFLADTEMELVIDSETITKGLGLISVISNGVDELIPFYKLKDSPARVYIKTREEMVPNILLNAFIIGAVEEKSPFIFEEKKLPIEFSLDSYRLNIAVTPQDSVLEPGGTTNIEITVKDAKDNLVDESQVALFVIDEAVLYLNGYTPETSTKFIKSFFPERNIKFADKYSQKTTRDYLEQFTYTPKTREQLDTLYPPTKIDLQPLVPPAPVNNRPPPPRGGNATTACLDILDTAGQEE